MESSQDQSVFEVNKAWAGYFPIFRRPTIVGYWSVDENRSVRHDSSGLQYYSPPRDFQVEFDLNQGIEAVKRKPENRDERLNHILEWIKYNRDILKPYPNSERWLRPQFVSYRGLLTKIMRTPYEHNEGWIICAAKWRGTIYLCHFDTEADKEAKANETPRQKQMCSWGFKFEQHVLTEAPNSQPDTSKPVNESEEFCCVLEGQLNSHLLFYGAEMDGVYSDEKLKDPLPLDELNFVELKTSRIIENERQLMTFEKFKLLRWWCQSFLAGVENIVCGFRDDRGIVRKLEEFQLAEIARRCQKHWRAAATMNFSDQFLHHVSRTVKNDCSRTLYKFERIPHGDIHVTELPPNSEYAFLPSWYTNLPM